MKSLSCIQKQGLPSRRRCLSRVLKRGLSRVLKRDLSRVLKRENPPNCRLCR
jgi:hypothetical protein